MTSENLVQLPPRGVQVIELCHFAWTDPRFRSAWVGSRAVSKEGELMRQQRPSSLPVPHIHPPHRASIQGELSQSAFNMFMYRGVTAWEGRTGENRTIQLLTRGPP